MKRSFIVVACMSFCFVLPAEHPIVSRNKSIKLSTLLARLEGLITLRLLMERARMQLRAEREAQHNYARGFLQHSRRGDKHKKPMFVHKQQYYNNNRVDSHKHTQLNPPTHQPRKHNHKPRENNRRNQ